MSWNSDDTGALPTVTFAVVAPGGVDAAARCSLESARAQHYPDRAVEVITAGSVEDALDRSSSDFVAFLRAGETWLPDKTEAQARLLVGRPEVALVYGDTTPPTFGIRRPRRGSVLGHLLIAPLAAPSTILVRTDIARAGFPPALVAPCPYWWVTLSAAGQAQLDFVDDPVAVAKLDTLATPAFRRAMLAQLVPGTVPVDQLLAALTALPVLPAIGDGRAERSAAVNREEAGDIERAIGHLVRALALDRNDALAAHALHRLVPNLHERSAAA